MDFTWQILELERFAFLANEDNTALLPLDTGQPVAPRHSHFLQLLLHQILDSRRTLGEVGVLLVTDDEDGGTARDLVRVTDRLLVTC